MTTSRILGTALFGTLLMATGTVAFGQTVNGHRPSDHTLDAVNNTYEGLYGDNSVYARPSATAISGYSVISPRDAELQRLDDIKKQTTDSGSITNAGPPGTVPVIDARDHRFMHGWAERNRQTGG
jgi:hypothetical protein